jgi:hypothetical protein
MEGRCQSMKPEISEGIRRDKGAKLIGSIELSDFRPYF